MIKQTTVLRIKDTPEARAAIAPLWEQRNAVMIEQGNVTNRMFAAIAEKDMVAAEQHREKLDALKLEEERLSREMHPHQTQETSNVQ